MNNYQQQEKDLHNYDGYYKYEQQVATTYEESRQIEIHWQREDKFIKQYVQKRKISKILDLPVGTGRFLNHYDGVGEIVGVDISEAMLTEASKKVKTLSFKDKVSLEKGDVLNLHFNDNEFDCVIVFRLFHLMPEESMAKSIEELCRVCSKDVVVQSYVTLSKFRRLLGKINNKFTGKKTVPKNNNNSTTWSHIQAYQHSQKFITSEFAKHNYFPTLSQLLDIYENSEVRATVFSKKD
jgi:ubiquinone/menaquinone biosynthesis C-methylase UbiE